MAKAIVKVLLKLIKGLLGVLLTPLNTLINSLINSVFGADMIVLPIQNLFAYILNIIGYVIDASMIPRDAIALVMLTIIFKGTLFLATKGMKLALHWYRILMP